MLRRLCVAILFLIGFSSLASAQRFPRDFILVGHWTAIVTQHDLQAGAGTDLKPTKASHPSAAIVVIRKRGDWELQIEREEEPWPPGLRLLVRERSGSFQEVTDTPETIMTGHGFSVLHMQYQLDGLSVRIPTGYYSARVSYSLIER